MYKKLLFSNIESEPPEGLIHFIASKNFENVNFFQNITELDSDYNFDNLQVYINDELTDQSANSISANADDDIKIIATSGKYPWFGHYNSTSSSYNIDYIKEIVEPLPTMYQYDGNEVTTFAECFYKCSSLTTIPAGLFDNNTEATNFDFCFRETAIAEIPAGLFDKNTKVTNFYSCFYDCRNITTIPAGLFDNCPNVTDFSYCFYYCTSLTSIPSGLFDNNIEVTNFSNCFHSAAITEIPAGLFDNCPNVTNFSYCFYNTDITEIPIGLFDKNTEVTSFYGCFYYCRSITTIPVGLFDKNTKAADFSFCFRLCNKLTPIVQIGSTASSVSADYFAKGCASRGTVYCREGSAAYTAFSESTFPNVNVLTY